MREVITTKDLREMCQNGVTLDDLRKLYGVNATLEDLELIMPSLLIGNLGLLPWSKVATESLSESQEESQDGKEEEMNPGQDGKEEKMSSSQDKMEGEVGSSEMEKSEEPLALLSSKDQQAGREIEPVHSTLASALCPVSLASDFEYA